MIILQKVETAAQLVRELEENNLVLLLDRSTSVIGVLVDVHTRTICPIGEEYSTRFGVLWRKSRTHRVDLRGQLQKFAAEIIGNAGVIPFILTIKIEPNDVQSSAKAIRAAKSLLEGRGR